MMKNPYLPYKATIKSVKEETITHWDAYQLLQKGLGPHNAAKVYSKAERYCDTRCEEPQNLSPIVTCVDKCEIWKVKNKALKFLES